jgi:hypothetical protein
MAEISGDGSKLTDITLEQITQYGAVTTRKLTVKNVVTNGTTFGISNTNPTDTLSIGTTAFINNIAKRVTVKGRLKADTYNVSHISTNRNILLNQDGNIVGANNITHNRSTGAFAVGGRFSAGKITVAGHAQNSQFLFSNAGTLEGAPMTYDNVTQETTIPGKLNILGGLKVLGSVSQVKVENVVIDDPILEISSNSEDNTTSGIVIHRPSGNVAMSYQDDNTFNLSYTNGSAYGTSLAVDTARVLPVKIQGTLRVLKGIDIQDKAQNKQLLFSNAGTIEGAPVTYDKTSNVTHVSTKLSFGKLQVGGHAQNRQVLYSNAGVMEGSGISYNATESNTTINGTLRVTSNITSNIVLSGGYPNKILFSNDGTVQGTTATYNNVSNIVSFPNKVNVSEINFL